MPAIMTLLCSIKWSYYYFKYLLSCKVETCLCVWVCLCVCWGAAYRNETLIINLLNKTSSSQRSQSKTNHLLQSYNIWEFTFTDKAQKIIQWQLFRITKPENVRGRSVINLRHALRLSTLCIKVLDKEMYFLYSEKRTLLQIGIFWGCGFYGVKGVILNHSWNHC